MNVLHHEEEDNNPEFDYSGLGSRFGSRDLNSIEYDGVVVRMYSGLE